jgi:hypothetical protein
MRPHEVVRLALLCDYALTSEDGKVSAIGLFSNINFASLPANYPRFFVLFVATLAPGTYNASIVLLGPDGSHVIPPGPLMNLEVPEGSNETNMIIGFDNLTFHAPGLHRLELRIDDYPAATIPFGVSASEGEGFPRGNA